VPRQRTRPRSAADGEVGIRARSRATHPLAPPGSTSSWPHPVTCRRSQRYRRTAREHIVQHERRCDGLLCFRWSGRNSAPEQRAEELVVVGRNPGVDVPTVNSVGDHGECPSGTPRVSRPADHRMARRNAPDTHCRRGRTVLVHRVWTYLVFASDRLDFAETERSTAPLTTAERQQFYTDLHLDDPRWVLNLAIFVVLLLAAHFSRVRELNAATVSAGPRAQTPDRR
jgi:hypothetical protein